MLWSKSVNLIQTPLRQEVFEKLQRLAEPLVGDASAVVECLLRHREATHSEDSRQEGVFPERAVEVWRMGGRVAIPAGTKLRARYRKREFMATVTPEGIEFDGAIYDTPSAAGIAVKEFAGTHGQAARTNGWTFWEMQEAKSGSWVPINSLRSS